MDPTRSHWLSRWMKEMDPLRFRLVALSLVVGLYLGWYSVASKDAAAFGWRVYVMFLLPPGWPLGAGHVLLWLGVACLAMMRCTAARNLGLWALVVTFLGSLIIQPDWPATAFKIASMIALTVAGIVGSSRFG